ncbi:hypothetical protein OFB74_36340, partial [Escherichia coli]|nr:hypothetical protein [Escherichia coli]
VGLGRPDRLADGATTGTPQADRNSLAVGSEGILTPIVGKPAEASIEISSRFGNTKVKGPGKKTAISLRAISGISSA